MKNILLITPVYPTPDIKVKGTPVVHYFTREWVKIGYKVLVCHCPANYPAIMRWIAKPLRGFLESRYNDYIPIFRLKESLFEYEGVQVARVPLKKIRPHHRYDRHTIHNVVERINSICCETMFTPDVIIGHWVIPSVDIMNELKDFFKVPSCLVLHSGGGDILRLYGDQTSRIINGIDVFGFRSKVLREKFESLYGPIDKGFYCYSGVPKAFFDDLVFKRDYSKVNTFIYVGMLIQRKYPFEVLHALSKSEIGDFSLKFIGEGDESSRIRAFIPELEKLSKRGSVTLLGHIPREEIKQHLISSDVFVMISKKEVFGLVYLEAMATGCIPIASRKEGFDGIIEDGVNGFLCEAGNSDELAQIINKLSKLTAEQRQIISENAIKTAKSMTDEAVANNYIQELSRFI